MFRSAEPRALQFSTWAQPVVSRPWALAAVTLHTSDRLTRYRLQALSAAKCIAFERACRVGRFGPNDPQTT
jgi:hypothetical protein